MRIGVIGSSRIGLLTAANFAELGHDVLCAGLGAGLAQFAGTRGCAKIRFTTSPAAAARHGQLGFIVLGTPGLGVGRASALARLVAAVIEIAKNLQGPAILINDGATPSATVGDLAQRMLEHTNQQIIAVADPVWANFIAPGLALALETEYSGARLGTTPPGEQKE